MILNKVKLILAAIGIILVIGGGIGTGVLIHKYNNLKEKYEISLNNEKAWEAQCDSLQNSKYVFQYTIEQLKGRNDSIARALTDAQKRLKIKDKELQAAQYMASHFTKTDTLTFRDTIFIEDFCMDTVVGDQWMNGKLHFEYPNIFSWNVNVESQKNVFISMKKETVNPPKKCWLARLFQKKHKVIKVDVEERNPYITNQENVFIQIVK